ncbi:MAG: pyrroline-5-carboxylate reductase [Lachnospiraceae bacterium]|nr:pyrroline-5-carboxylate reductase [Lachnospiraceae bacterium]
MAEIGFIGMGNMGSAIMKGLLKHGFQKETLTFTDVSEKQRGKLREETGVEPAGDNRTCAGMVKYLVLAVKPQYYAGVLEEIRPVLKPEQVIISIAPGKTIDYLKGELGADKRIVRAMPNTPALLGEGMTGVSYEEAAFSEEEKAVIRQFFCSFGKMEMVEERLMDAVVCVSGSSPAYVYLFIEALADGAVKCGLPRDKAYQMAAQTVLGSARMVLETGKHPGELKDMVCSPGGTTIAAVEALEQWGFRNAVMKATDACYDKCRSI